MEPTEGGGGGGGGSSFDTNFIIIVSVIVAGAFMFTICPRLYVSWHKRKQAKIEANWSETFVNFQLRSGSPRPSIYDDQPPTKGLAALSGQDAMWDPDSGPPTDSIVQPRFRTDVEFPDDPNPDSKKDRLSNPTSSSPTLPYNRDPVNPNQRSNSAKGGPAIGTRSSQDASDPNQSGRRSSTNPFDPQRNSNNPFAR